MKFFEPTEKRNTIAVYVFIVALFCVLCVILGVNISVIPRIINSILLIFRPLIYGIIIAFMLHPLVCTIEFKVFKKWVKKPKIKHIISVLVAYLVVIGFLVIFLFAVIPQFISSYNNLEDQFENFASGVNNTVTEIINNLPGRSPVYAYYDVPAGTRVNLTDDVFASSLRESSVADLASKAEETQAEISEAMDSIFERASNFFMTSLPNIFTITVNFLTEAKNVLVGLCVSVYCLLSTDMLLKNAQIFLKAWMPKKIFRRLSIVYDKGKNIFKDYVIVRLLDSIIIGVLTFFVLLICRAQYAFFLSVIMGIASLIPFIGPAIGITLGAIVIIIVEPKYAILFIVVMIVIKIIDSKYIEKFLNHGHQQYKLPAIWIFASIVIMGGAFGIIGFLIGIPLFAFIYSLLKDFCERRLKNKSLPTETSEWMAKEPAAAAVGEEDN